MILDKIWFVDLVFILIISGVSIGGVCLPRVIIRKSGKRDSWGKMIFHVGNAMSGGVMLGGALCHLLPDAAEAIGPTKYPIGFCVAGLGYMLTSLMESVAMQLMSRVSGNCCHDCREGHDSVEQGVNKTTSQEVSDQSDTTNNVMDTVQLGCHRQFHGDNTVGDLLIPILDTAESGASGRFIPSSKDQGHTTTNEAMQSNHGKFMSALILGLALSYHSALTGTAIGSQSTLIGAINLMGVVLAHKLMESFALGSSIVACSTSPSRSWALTLMYSASLPIGILTSYFLAAEGSTTLTGYMCALSAGTFLFVGIGEILSTEMADPSHRFKKLCGMFVGFFVMACLPLLES